MVRCWVGKHTRHTYDAANRLTGSQRGTTIHRYAFDPVGNRVAPNPHRRRNHHKVSK